MTEAVETTEETRPVYRRPERVADLASLADTGAIIVRNNLQTIAVLVVKVDGAEDQSEFGPRGATDGTDIMEFPSSYLKNAQFRKQLQLGIFEIIDADDPAVLDAFESQKQAWAAAQIAKTESDRFIDAQQPKAFSGRQCIEQEGRNQCPEYAIFAQNNRERPPLCSRHAHLSSQYTPFEPGTFSDGKPDVEWRRVSILGR